MINSKIESLFRAKFVGGKIKISGKFNINK